MKLQWKSRLHRMVVAGVFAALLAVLSQISIPLPTGIPVTLQTFAVALCGFALGPGLGAAAVGVYLALGAVGIPVFAGFSGGIGVILGTTGGYILGFLFSALAMWGMEKLAGRKPWMQVLIMILGLLVCYAFGTAWFMVVYMASTGPVGLFTVLGWCVFPFLLPDVLKLLLALVLGRRIGKYAAIRR